MAGPMALLTGIMTLASFVPAWRAARVDPNILLKDA
jgi:ABC-type antimicrobial peptide transport system permease subunit